MNLKIIRKSINQIIRKIKQIKIGLHLELKILKTKKQISFPFFRSNGSKSRIYVSLAFKSGVEDNAPSDGARDDLYLKGQGYDSSEKPVNFDETIVGEGHHAGRSDPRWALKVFSSGTTRLASASGVDYDETINCDKKGLFEKKGDGGEVWKNGMWEKTVNSVKFKVTNCEKTGGRRECDIEIEDSICFKNKNSSAFKDKLGKTTKDLYLKDQGYDSFGKLVNFDEKMPPENGKEVGDGQTKYVWQLAVYKSETTRFMTTGGGNMGSSSGDVECDGKPFVVTKPNMGGTEDWEKAVTDIPYYLVDTDIAIRQEIFEMKRI